MTQPRAEYGKFQVFPALTKDVDEQISDTAFQGICEVIQDETALVFQASMATIEEQWSVWQDKLCVPLMQAGSLRLRYSQDSADTVFRVAIPDVLVETQGIATSHFFDIELSDVNSNNLQALHNTLLTEAQLQAVLRGVERGKNLFADALLPQADLGEVLIDNVLLTSSPLEYVRDGKSLNADPLSDVVIPPARVDYWSNQVGLPLKQIEIGKHGIRRSAVMAWVTTANELLAAAESNSQAVLEQPIDISEITILLRSAKSLRESTGRRSVEATITRSDVAFDQKGAPTRETLYEFNLHQDISALGITILGEMTPQEIRAVAASEVSYDTIITRAREQGMDARMSVVKILEGNTALLDAILNSDNYKRLAKL